MHQVSVSLYSESMSAILPFSGIRRYSSLILRYTTESECEGMDESEIKIININSKIANFSLIFGNSKQHLKCQEKTTPKSGIVRKNSIELIIR
jgi:hypothetical protein